MTVPEQYAWWQKGIVYQIYPRSFADTNGDGIGDLRGIERRLDYLQWLGIDAIWISPFYPSPMADFGYDISDYTNVDPVFGTLEDFDRLLEAAHARGLRVILDWVPNHTSDQHPWFLDSRGSRDSARRDWYIWRDPAPDGGPPNNWRSVFGGSAWEFDQSTGQYYYHAFLPEQPDLNWRNPAVKEAMFRTLRFWLDRGVDGFRVDVIWHLIKDDQFRNNPRNQNWTPQQPSFDELVAVFSTDRPEIHDLIAEMREVIDSYPERLLVGEVYLPTERLMAYYGPTADGTHMPYNFQLILLPWEARIIETAVINYEAALPPGGWPNWVIGNHDKPRIASRVGSAQARVAAMMLLTLRGTPTMYYGDELGMMDVPVPPDRIQDPFEKREPGKGNGRDPQRTPMPWSSDPYAGFSVAEPWLPLGSDWPTTNVEAQKADPDSMLNLVRSLIALRSGDAPLSVGTWKHLPASGNLIAWVRRFGDSATVVVLNLGGEVEELALPEEFRGARIVLDTHGDRRGESAASPLLVRGNEGLILK